MPIEIPVLYWTTLLGAFGSFVFQKNRERIPFSVLRAFHIETGRGASGFVLILDAIITSMLGAALAFLFAAPGTNQQAIAIGVGCAGIIAMLEKGDHHGNAT